MILLIKITQIHMIHVKNRSWSLIYAMPVGWHTLRHFQDGGDVFAAVAVVWGGPDRAQPVMEEDLSQKNVAKQHTLLRNRKKPFHGACK